MRWRILILLCASVSLCELSFASEEKEPHAVIVVGTHHYSPHLSMPLFAKELERFGFRTTTINPDSDAEKRKENVLPGIEALADADVAIFYMRFLKLPDEEWQPIEEYLQSGKPVIGLRTASHSFRYDKSHPRYEWNDGFGRRALGTPYIVHQQGTTAITAIEKNLSHPIMAHLPKTEWVSPGTLYLTRLEGGCIPLVMGTGEGRERLVERDFGAIQVHKSEADIVAWAWENEWGGKVFGTSFGHTGDFAEEAVVRMLVNAAHWAVDKPVPDANAKITTWKIERAGKKKRKAKK